jgi:hypothetical protein
MKTQYQAHEIKLANELAETLNDVKSLPFYLSLTRKHNEAFLRESLAKVLARRAKGEIDNMGAYFNRVVNPEK